MTIPPLLDGYPLLFLTSLAASSILPVGSEWLLALQIARGADPVAVVSVASTGNLLGALTTYWVGRAGGEWIGRRFAVPPERREQVERIFARYGSWSLLLSWMPVIGDPLCLVAGGMHLGVFRFLVLTGAGKIARYSVVAWLVLKGVPPEHAVG